MKIIIFSISIFFIISSSSSLVFGDSCEWITAKDAELNQDLINLRYLCTSPFGFDETRFNYLKQELLLHNDDEEDTISTKIIDSVVDDKLLLTLDSPMNYSWPMKCHDNRHTSLSPYSTADNPLEEIWNFRTSSSFQSGIIIGNDDTIYFGAFDYRLHAVNKYGRELWNYKVGGRIWSCPAIADDGTIYVTSFDDHLYSINHDGSLKWSFVAEDSIVSSPAIGDDGTIYFGTMGEGCNIFAINPNGTEKWRYGTGYYITSDPAIGDDGTVYIGSGDEYLYAMNPNGTMKWRYKTNDVIKGPASIADDGTVYVGSWDEYIYAIYPNGTLKWKHQIEGGTECNPSIGPDGTIYCGYMDLYAINPNGTRKWTFDYGGNRYSHQSSPAISADGTIFIGDIIGTNTNDGGEFLAVNPDGTELWREQISNEDVQSSPCIGSDGTVYVGSTSRTDQGDPYGTVHAFGEWNPTAPTEPSITGETEGQYGESYEYTFMATDPENQDIWYLIEWGDGTSDGWLGPYPSGEDIAVSHVWEEENTYTIRARAKDTMDVESPWGALEVTMPVNQPVQYPLLELFRQRFPLLYQLFIGMLEELNI
jgi:outer membrane protein assembly factor BamB